MEARLFMFLKVSYSADISKNWDFVNWPGLPISKARLDDYESVNITAPNDFINFLTSLLHDNRHEEWSVFLWIPCLV